MLLEGEGLSGDEDSMDSSSDDDASGDDDTSEGEDFTEDDEMEPAEQANNFALMQ
jgi:hypothetical protein